MDASTSFVFVALLNKQQILTAIAQTIMGDQNCSLAILARAWPDLAVDAGMRVLCVDYLLVKQNSNLNLPEFSA